MSQQDVRLVEELRKIKKEDNIDCYRLWLILQPFYMLIIRCRQKGIHR